MKNKIFQLLIGASIFIGTSSVAECQTKYQGLNHFVQNSESQMVYNAYKASICG